MRLPEFKPPIICTSKPPKKKKKSTSEWLKEGFNSYNTAHPTEITPELLKDMLKEEDVPTSFPVPEAPVSKPAEDKEYDRISKEAKIHRENTDHLNSAFQKGITLSNNLNGQIITVTLPSAGTEVGIRHNLNVTPKYRIILKHMGDGIILDGDTAWDGTTVYFKASQATENITTTILLMRE